VTIRVLFLFLTLSVLSKGATDRPVIFVPGWGPKVLTSQWVLRSFFEEDGYDWADLHEVRYPYRGRLSRISASLNRQFTAIFDEYSPETQFDMITHSFGHFVALYALLDNGLSDRIVNYVGLAGAAHGGDRENTFMARLFWGRTAPLLWPFNNPFIQSVMNEYSESISSLKLCSLYSYSDEVLANPDSGKFENGINIEIPDASHLSFIHSRAIYETMVWRCGL